jgi:hypothetical protein
LLSAASAGGMALITETVVGGGGAANVNFTSIPSTYRDLRVVIRGRSDEVTANNFSSVRIRFNGDTAANYGYQATQGSNTTTSSFQNLSLTGIPVGYVTASGAPANVPAACECTVYDYRGTTFSKEVSARAGLRRSATAGEHHVETAYGWWTGTAAISSLDVYIPTGGGSFIAGTVISLYGIL